MLLEGVRRSWRVECSSDPEGAIERMGSESFDCVVSDMRMPAMDGASLLGRVVAAQPGTIDLQNADVVPEEMGLSSDLAKKIGRVYFVACGTSAHSAMAARYWVEQLAKIDRGNAGEEAEKDESPEKHLGRVFHDSAFFQSASCGLHQIIFDERVERAVEHAVDIGSFVSGANVLHEPVGREDVVADRSSRVGAVGSRARAGRDDGLARGCGTRTRAGACVT